MVGFTLRLVIALFRHLVFNARVFHNSISSSPLFFLSCFVFGNFGVWLGIFFEVSCLILPKGRII